MKTSIEYEVFIRKMVLVSLFRKEEHLKYEDIAYILNSSPEVIKTYDVELLQKERKKFFEAGYGGFHG